MLREFKTAASWGLEGRESADKPVVCKQVLLGSTEVLNKLVLFDILLKCVRFITFLRLVWAIESLQCPC